MLLCLLVVVTSILGSWGCREDLLEVPCPDTTVCRCARLNSSDAICCNLDSVYLFKEGLACAGVGSNVTTELMIRNSTIDIINADIFDWSNVPSLTIFESNINKINGSFRGEMMCVNLSGNSITEISDSAFVHLPELRSLDLSNNNLTKVPPLSSTPTQPNITVDISGNSRIWCSSVKDLMLGMQNTSTSIQFSNYNASSCLSYWSFHWFNTTDSVPLAQLEVFIRLEQECPRGINYSCQCSSSRVDITPGKPPRFSVTVDCSGQQLTQLPSRLPPNTILLNVTDNNITDLDPLIEEPSYQDVREFYADNNNIESINSLEGSSFIRTFTILSLKGNKLKSIPTYILSDTFDRNLHPRHVKLGENKLNCDCNTAQVLKMWLLTNKDHIQDYDDILCEQDLKKVIFLDPKKLCVYDTDWTEYIYYIIGIEVFLLVLLISKVTYDYWVFKTAGYLPWPASKMPKLPCDWVFES